MCLVLQSKLNCEVLHEDLAFEVRWAVAGDSVVVQLVAKLGKNRLCLVYWSLTYPITNTFQLSNNNKYQIVYRRKLNNIKEQIMIVR